MALGLSLLALLSACSDKTPVEKERPRVFVQEVKPAHYAASVTLTGDVQARVPTGTPIAREVFWGPMAYAMIGGIIVATLLTLLFLPALYVAWYKIGEPNKDGQ